MTASPATRFHTAFSAGVRRPEFAGPLKAASEHGSKEWTRLLTLAVVETCRDLGWRPSARDHPAGVLPEGRSEYLALDLMAFPSEDFEWPFPVAVAELENSRSTGRVAYSLWKVLVTRAPLRLVYCYRAVSAEAAPLVDELLERVVRSKSLQERRQIEGETLIVVGNRGESATFPYGFFTWWKLDIPTATSRRM